MNKVLNYFIGKLDCEKYGLHEPEDMVEEWFPKGAVFKYINSNSKWKIVDYIDDEIEEGKIKRLVVFKTTNKQATYEVKDIRSFLYIMYLGDFMKKNHPYKKFIDELQKLKIEEDDKK